ncbi:collagenase [Streptomyces sp. NPDC046197]|uniref:collagenase n=1 Tax=Streptomyces sp. NPDC046197 TaxID=3154337 RepID=UPI0033E8E527
MRYRFTLPGCLVGALVAGAALTCAPAAPALAAPAQRPATGTVTGPLGTRSPVPPTGSTVGAPDRTAVQRHRLTPAELPPLRPTTAPDRRPAAGRPKKADCTPAAFGSRTGSALVRLVRASTTDCVNTLFSVTGTDARRVFRQSQMVTVARAFTAAARGYRGDNTDSIWQLVLFLRAGYYVQYNDPTDVGPYGAPLEDATTAGLDAFFARPHAQDVTSANGDVLGDVVILTDSADQQARYLPVYQQLLDGYDSSYDDVASMLAAVNDVYTPLWRGNWNPDYVDAVTDDPDILGTLQSFALGHLDLLGTDRAYLDSNAGMDLARHVEHPALQATVRPLIDEVLNASAITGPTAALWVAVASQADSYDRANCSYYDICNLADRLIAAALPVTRSCDPAHDIRAQALTPEELDAVCRSILGQDPYVHALVQDNGPVPGQYVSTVRLVVFADRTAYQTYAGAIFGVSTDNGGITMEGNPSDPHNQPVSIMYQKNYDDGFTARVWNLNHEYTHFLDARDDMKGDFTQQTTVPDIWWIEGLAEYASYGYRGLTDDQAVTEAAKHTYTLSTLFENTYANSDVTRTYPWGYLAVRYMFEHHPADIQHMLARFRVGDYTGGYAVYHSGIGTRYDADFDRWLTDCAAGACSRPART